MRARDEGALRGHRPSRADVLLGVLSVEKVIQHTFVTWAFVADRFEIRESVELDYRVLAAAGLGVGALFGVALYALIGALAWRYRLLIALALVDIVGEFLAQGTLAITLMVSFIVALVILVVSAVAERGRARQQQLMRN
jgi:hypothetical protein